MKSIKTLYLSVSLAAVLAVSMITMPTASALIVLTDLQGDWLNGTDPNFDIKNVEVNEKGDVSMSVYGKAGATTPTDISKVLAYVFATDNGIYAVTSHIAEDSTEVPNDLKWHAHKVTLDGAGCVTSLLEDGNAKVVGDTVTVKGSDATTVTLALTAELTITFDGSGNVVSVCATTPFDAAVAA